MSAQPRGAAPSWPTEEVVQASEVRNRQAARPMATGMPSEANLSKQKEIYLEFSSACDSPFHREPVKWTERQELQPHP